MDESTDVYGPNTAAVQRLIARSDNITRFECDRMFDYSFATRETEYQSLLMPRDFAWAAFHESVALHGLANEFQTLWDDLLVRPPARPVVRDRLSLVVTDPICATLLEGYVDSVGPFRRTDYDTLMAPWRAVLEGDQRSRLALAMFASWPHPGGELWGVVDAVLVDGSV